MGLLTKITNTATEIKPCFSTFCKKYGFVHAGVFSIVDGMYILTKAFALDAETIFHSVSTPDFWKGSIQSSSCWHTFSSRQENLTGFYQFFSNDFKTRLSSVHFITFTFNKVPFVFMSVQLDNEHTIPLPEVTPSFLYELSQTCTDTTSEEKSVEQINTQISESIAHCPAALLSISFENTFMQLTKQSTFITINLCNQAKKTIFDELSSLIEMTFSGMHIAVPVNDNAFHVAFFTPQVLDEQLIHFQIAQTCKPVIGNSFNNTISVFISETTRSAESIQNFLLSE